MLRLIIDETSAINQNKLQITVVEGTAAKGMVVEETVNNLL
jgi:hypothetical protein